MTFQQAVEKLLKSETHKYLHITHRNNNSKVVKL